MIQELLTLWFFYAVGLWIVSGLFKNIVLKNFFFAFLAAIILTGVNQLFRPALTILTLPINILTLGLFTLVINGAMLKLSAFLLPGFQVRTWGSAIAGSLVLSIFLFFTELFLSPWGISHEFKFYHSEPRQGPSAPPRQGEEGEPIPLFPPDTEDRAI